ncbi:aldehyde dehydrogenase family protein [Synechococcus sp. PCC 6312]|uniref:aldehyde dehydrogenase family protein n=1 Tax=Synechococcus sp. (strain ATCC 27167 / PCC 6312) TaxID=195253 RepID=UPI00029F48F6|nr:aldehyde dehydrogenase family protein [Synechococcus sp. PCC 6312]AFY59469.1 NAD-dependent aldehyde dehydrogenase [Synechococcus sp. PCC 6312]
MTILTPDFQILDSSLEQLQAHKSQWPNVTIPERIRIIQQLIQGIAAVAEDWANTSCQLKGIDPHSNLAGEEWTTGPAAILIQLQQLIVTLQAKGQPQPPQWRTGPQGQDIAQVLPANWQEKFIWFGYRAEVWLESGKPRTQGKIYREPPGPGGVALVLGAGNISSIAPLDVLYKLFAENQVVILKMNPLNAALGQYLERAWRALIEAGYLAIVYGGAEVGDYLCQHPMVESVHITGSQATHDLIVWGKTKAEQTEHKQNQTPRLQKPITSELGNITPVVIIPGQWSASELQFQARQVVSLLTHNASFNCVGAQVLVISQAWPQKQEFLTRIRHILAQTPQRNAYYPGAKSRYHHFLDHYPQAEVITSPSNGLNPEETIPWTVIPNIPDQAGEFFLEQEVFCGVLGIVTLNAADTPTFLKLMVDCLNQRVQGTLGCNLIIDPRTERQYQSEFNQAVSELDYGTITINLWAAVAFSLGVTPWGAFPKHNLESAGSGLGFVHNTFLFDYPQKSVIHAPFIIVPTPAWFVDHRNLLALAKALVHYYANPNLWTILPLIWAGLWG